MATKAQILKAREPRSAGKSLLLTLPIALWSFLMFTGKARLHVDVEPLNPRYEAVRNVSKEKFSALIVRVDDAVLVRVPLTQQ